MVKRRWLGFCGVISLLVLTGCGQTRTSDADIRPVEYRQLVEMLGNPKKRTVLIDVRTARKFSDGHIPGAINIPINQLRSGDSRLARAKNIVVYAAKPEDLLSRAAYKTLLRFGYQNLYDFQGGLMVWRSKHKTQGTPDQAREEG